MGNASEYKTFNGQIGKGLGISAPSPQKGLTEKTFICEYTMLKQCREGRKMTDEN